MPRAALRRGRHAALPLHTWGPADVGGEEPVGSLPGVWAHQEELPEVGHVEHGRGPPAGQTLLLDLKSSRVGVPWGLRDPPPRERPSPPLQLETHVHTLLGRRKSALLVRMCTVSSGAGKSALRVQETRGERGPREDRLQRVKASGMCSLTTMESN